MADDTEFKEGDEVQCIVALNCACLKVGQTYTLYRRTSWNGLYLKCSDEFDPHHPLSTGKFEISTGPW